MGLYVDDPTNKYAFAHAEAPELDRKLKQGDGIVWGGDPRLELGMETMEFQQSCWVKELGRRVRKGEIACRRYAVYRHCEDGTTERIGHWRLEEFDRILWDIAAARLDSPNHESVLDQIDKANAETEANNTRAFVDAAGDKLEHQLKLMHDIREGRNVFRGMPGMRDLKLPESVDMTAKVESPVSA